MGSSNEEKWDWLEAQTAPECLAWVDSENEKSKAQFESFSRIGLIQDQLEQLSKSTFPTPEFCLLRDLFRIRKDDDHRYGVLEVAKLRADGQLGDWDLVLDIGQLRETECRSWEIQGNPFLRQSILHLESSSRILLRLSDAGSDFMQIREFDVKTRAFVPGGFNTEPDRAVATWIDINHILIAHGLDGAPKESTGWPLDAFIWTRGTKLKEAKRVFSGSASDAIVLIGNVGLGDYQRGLVLRIMDFSHREYHLLEPNGTTHKLSVPEAIKLETVSYHTTSSHLVALLNEETDILDKKVPSGTVIAYDLTNSLPAEKRTAIVYIPEPDEFNIKTTFDGIIAGYSTVHMILTKLGRERRLVLKFKDGNWETVQNVPSSLGVSAGLSASDAYSDYSVVTESGLLSPTTAWLESIDGERQNLFSHTACFDASKFSIVQQALLKYSPFHNVKNGVEYPPFLITISTTDDRVGAGHARKLAARLLEVGAHVVFYEDREGGHGVSDSLSSTTLLSRRMAFLMDTLMGKDRG